MEIFKVGGAVRDMVMGITPTDIDYVITGVSSFEELESLGYKQVGSDFPVFLHPETGEEYALARTERKTGSGYHGFSTHFGPDVTLEEDLFRRDLTINSMAINDYGNIIDPFGGVDDIHHMELRHTSSAFVEDPVRVLRIFRFHARFGPEWTIAKETQELIQQIKDSGELNHLTKERVWLEFKKALGYAHTHIFLDGMLDLGLFPEISRYNVRVLERIGRDLHPHGKFAILMAGKTIPQIRGFCKKYKICREFRLPSEPVAFALDHLTGINDTPEKILSVIKVMKRAGIGGRFVQYVFNKYTSQTGNTISICANMYSDIDRTGVVDKSKTSKEISLDVYNYEIYCIEKTLKEMDDD